MENSGFKSYTPVELKKLSVERAAEYCNEIRNFMIENVSATGGHLASNLGVCEISVALMRVFDPPKDKIIYDVGHQSYVHKILTGRSNRFDTMRKLGGLSGFTKISESEYDAFGAGHSSTSVSAALGYAKAARLSGEDYHSIAVIGDGAFTGGMAYEGLNNCDENDNIIIVLNENEMSISKNVGKISQYFAKIRNRKAYFNLKRNTEKLLSRIPVAGPLLSHFLEFFKTFMRRLVTNSNMFEQLGIKYYGPADGNDLETVELLLNEAKRHRGPSFIHLYTVKGKGYVPAEENPSGYHSVSGVAKHCDKYENMSDAVGEKIVEMAQRNNRICAITAAMSDGVGFKDFESIYPERFFDVGIAEEHAVTFAAGLAAAGYLPCVAFYSTFFQRAYDQLIHDVALQELKIILMLDHAGLVGEDGPTHHGVFDVSMLLNIPGIEIYSPSNGTELKTFLDMAEHSQNTSVIRYPKSVRVGACEKAFLCHGHDELCSFNSGKADVVIVTYGQMASNAVEAAELLEGRGIKAAVYRVAVLKPFDIKAFKDVLETLSPRLVYVLEEGMRTGGFGEHLNSMVSSVPFYINAIDDHFVTFGSTHELYGKCGFLPGQIADEIAEMSVVNESRCINI